MLWPTFATYLISVALFQELKRRNVFRVGIAYAVGAWVLLQVLDVVGEILDLPAWGGKLILAILVVGFFIALIVAWAFEHSQIATLVERHSRHVLLAKIKNKDTETVIYSLIKQAHKLPRELYKSLTWDRGKEMADHKRFTLDTDIKVHFCDPQSPWQRGSNENTNGLLRQYFPKGMDLSNVHQNRLNAVARRLNERPRETLNFETPAERFNHCVAATG
jgi:IS30 family transposase